MSAVAGVVVLTSCAPRRVRHQSCIRKGDGQEVGELHERAKTVRLEETTKPFVGVFVEDKEASDGPTVNEESSGRKCSRHRRVENTSASSSMVSDGSDVRHAMSCGEIGRTVWRPFGRCSRWYTVSSRCLCVGIYLHLVHSRWYQCVRTSAYGRNLH